MKKFLSLILLVLSVALILVSCNAPEEQSAEDTEVTENTEAPVIPDDENENGIHATIKRFVSASTNSAIDPNTFEIVNIAELNSIKGGEFYGYLVDVIERTAIHRLENEAAFEENGELVKLPFDSIASMNCWGFTSDVFEKVEEGFKKFLSNIDDTPNPCKAEYYLPFSVREIMDAGTCRVKVYSSNGEWYGVTYHEDKEKVMAGIKALVVNGEYPSVLNG